MTQESPKLVGHVKDVIEPRRPKSPTDRFYGFITSESNETLYFRCSDLAADWQAPASELVNKVVSCEAVTTPPHKMRQAVNIDIISGAAA